MSAQPKNLTGQQFGRLVAIRATSNRHKDGSVMWECRCQCGKIKVATSRNLVAGRTKSCGCIRVKNLTGSVFTNLTVISLHGSRRGHSLWSCLCLCGNQIAVPGCDLTSGNTKSCGCYRKEKAQERLRHDLGGKKFGRLTVIKNSATSVITSPTQRRTFWECICECGKKTKATAGNLKKGHVMSCGCLRLEIMARHQILSMGNSENKDLDLPNQLIQAQVLRMKINRELRNQGHKP